MKIARGWQRFEEICINIIDSLSYFIFLSDVQFAFNCCLAKTTMQANFHHISFLHQCSSRIF